MVNCTKELGGRPLDRLRKLSLELRNWKEGRLTLTWLVELEIVELSCTAAAVNQIWDSVSSI